MANKKNSKKTLPNPDIQNKTAVPVSEKPKQRFSVNLKLALFLGLISLIVYANTLRNGYVLDDVSVITQNNIVTKGIPAIPEILSTPYRRGYWESDNDSYRPLSLVMFAVEYQFFGHNPMPSHFINILLYAGCVVLLFFFLDALFEREKTAVAFTASLLFALHPIHTEAVANIKSRDELLSFFFAFLCLNVLIKYMREGKISQLLIGSFCFLLSIFSKETVISFLAVILLVFFFYRNENKKRVLYISACAVLVSIIALATRYSVLSAYHANDFSDIPFINNPLAKTGVAYTSRIATALLISGYYIRLLFIPYPLVCDYSYGSFPIVNFNDPRVLISLALYIFLVVYSLWRFAKNHKDPYSFGVLFFLIMISLYSNIFFLINATMGERFLFFGSAGFCLVIVLLIEKWTGKTPGPGISSLRNAKVLGIIIPLSLVYAFMTINRNSDWKDNYTLYSTDIKKAPQQLLLNFWLGTELISNVAKEESDPSKQKAIRDEGIKYLNKSLAIYPDYNLAHMNLGYEYAAMQMYDSAEVHIRRALELFPKDTISVKNLAMVYFGKKKYPEAIELYKNLIKLNPNDKDVLTQIGEAYSRCSLYDSGEVYDRRALRIDPNYTIAIKNLGVIYNNRKDYREAIELFTKAIKLKPGVVDDYTNIAGVYFNSGKFDSGIYYLYQAVSIDPSYNKSYEFLARAYKITGKTDSAKKYEAIAQKNDPGLKL